MKLFTALTFLAIGTAQAAVQLNDKNNPEVLIAECQKPGAGASAVLKLTDCQGYQIKRCANVAMVTEKKGEGCYAISRPNLKKAQIAAINGNEMSAEDAREKKDDKPASQGPMMPMPSIKVPRIGKFIRGKVHPDHDFSQYLLVAKEVTQKQLGEVSKGVYYLGVPGKEIEKVGSSDFEVMLKKIQNLK